MQYRFGWKAGPEQYPPVELLEYALAAEQAGFESIDVSDHFHPWSEAGQAAFTWTWLGATAVQTEHIRLGTGLTCPILRYHPAIIAQAAATLACFAPGRTYLSVGTGEALNEYPVIGQWPGYETRQEMLEEAIYLIRLLWSGDEITFEGEYYETHKARLYTLPEEDIPIYISSLVPDSAGFAGFFGDGLITVGGKEHKLYQGILEEFEAGAREAGKDPENMPRLIELNVAYTENEDAAIQEMKKYWAGSFVPALFDQKIYTPKDSAKNGKVVGSETLRQAMCISADPQKQVAYAQRYLDLGFSELYFHSAGPDQRAFLQDFGRDVLPKLKEAVRGQA